jgi:spermidine/putrescine transport system ATP-binding protein
MIGIRLEGITKKYRGELIIEGLNLVIEEGKFFALLGPSGSGKTTILRLIAGFETVDAGKIYLGDEDITYAPIHERPVKTVFQNYALFPHLNVFDNVAYGLRIRKMESSVVEQKVIRILKAVHLEAHMYKSVEQLSGGQQQRVALARAIVNEPDVLLLDEPLAALDLNLREKMLVELVDLQERFRTTFVYVTHDQAEALAVADKMAIMNPDGEIEQIGTPKEIYEFPVSSFVAQFVGTTNIIKGTIRVTESEAFLNIKGLGDVAIQLPQDKRWASDGNHVVLSLRPEKIDISKKPLEGFSNHLTGVVESIVYQGRSTQYKVRLRNDMQLQVFEQNEEHFPQEVIDYYDEVNLYWQKENAIVLEK